MPSFIAAIDGPNRKANKHDPSLILISKKLRVSPKTAANDEEQTTSTSGVPGMFSL